MNHPLTLNQKAASLMLLQPLNADEDSITDEVRGILRRLAADKAQQEVVDVEPVKPLEGEVATALVLYNPFSLDSLMAATLMVSCTQKFAATTQSHHFIDTKVNVGKVDTVIAVGMEINSDLLVNMLESNPALNVVLVGYRDSYEWLQKSEYVYKAKKWWSKDKPGFVYTTTVSPLFMKYRDRLQLLKPLDDDSYGEMITKTDNTLTKVVQFWLQSKDHTISPEWLKSCDLVARMYGMSLPLAGMSYQEEKDATLATDAANRVLLHELSVKLRAALGSNKPVERIREIKLSPNVDNYRTHKGVMEEMFSRSMHDTNVPAAVGTYHKVRIAQMSENVVNELIALPSIASKDVVFYTDIKRFRVWRVYSPNHGKARAIVACFKPTAQWSEGMFACGITYVEGIA